MDTRSLHFEMSFIPSPSEAILIHAAQQWEILYFGQSIFFNFKKQQFFSSFLSVACDILSYIGKCIHIFVDHTLLNFKKIQLNHAALVCGLANYFRKLPEISHEETVYNININNNKLFFSSQSEISAVIIVVWNLHFIVINTGRLVLLCLFALVVFLSSSILTWCVLVLCDTQWFFNRYLSDSIAVLRLIMESRCALKCYIWPSFDYNIFWQHKTIQTQCYVCCFYFIVNNIILILLSAGVS